MSKCIYTKLTEDDTTFKTREHIFPAGIGGVKMLKKGDVSDCANEYFSKLELKFMRDSLISIPRMFYGPGKRGSFSSKKRTKSKVSLMRSKDNLFLGYIELSTPKSITQLNISYDDIKENKKTNLNLRFPLDRDINESCIEFIKKIKSNRYIKIDAPDLDIDNFIVGVHLNKLFIACNKKSKLEEFHAYLKKSSSYLEKVIKESIEEEKLKVNKNEVEVALGMSFDIAEYNRVCSKIAFNALCHLKGSNFVLKEEFDEIRSFIIKGEGNPNKFVQLQKEKLIMTTKDILKVGETDHSILFSKVKNNELCAILTLYGTDHLILLSDKYLGDPVLDGFICNWKEKKEEKLTERVSSKTF